MPLTRDGNVEDEAYAADAMGLVRQLPDFIRSARADCDYTKTTPTVFLTGATGFLGSYILHELLDGPTKARVIAHVRAEDAVVGLNRLESTMKAYGLWSRAWITTSRLEVVSGDISKPQLSLSQTSGIVSRLESTLSSIMAPMLIGCCRTPACRRLTC